MDSKLDNELRDSLYKSIYEEFVGPLDPSSEEVLPQWSRPTSAYSAGILYPIGSEFQEYETSSDNSSKNSPSENDDSPETEKTGDNCANSPADEEEPVALSNADMQSAISLTFALRTGDTISLTIDAARYKSEFINESACYKRIPIHKTVENAPLPLPGRPTIINVEETNLQIMLVYRYHFDNETVFTGALRNAKKNATGNRPEYSSCYYQARLSINSNLGFAPIPANGSKINLSAEERSKRLIYRDVLNYAIGHGCAANWEDGTNRPTWIRSEIMPIAETRPVKTSVESIPSSYFDMFDFAKQEQWENTVHELRELCNAYDNWINKIETEAESLPAQYSQAAHDNISKCRHCLERMRRGVEILKCNEKARTAFTRANEAMLSQYLHYSVVANECSVIREPAHGLRKWRPFQIAFLLMNIESSIDSACDDHQVVDLIWFPTGGGKTEAYLGLSAFVLIYERLTDSASACSSIIMRYTLRLLTAQQFDRAASLICALETMRKAEPSLFGEKPFSIGLWAGSAASPNTWEQAIKIRKDLKSGAKPDGTIPVSCCPWCGTPMGEKGEGYREARDKEGNKILLFVCPNSKCDFGNKQNPLPLKVVDEDIYSNPPSLLLGTVDKFAMIPYRPESYAIFGIDAKRRRIGAPKLIIQDELHLITGPLGSMVAHYETLVSWLCERNGQRPKIIASTATVSRAAEQCHELFDVPANKIFQFPPSGINHDDSFFSATDFEKPGRRYVGLYIPNLSYATASIRLYSRLLWTPVTWNLPSEDKDAYWTVVGYYGTTRELGQAATWADSDIKERLFEYRRANKELEPRYLRKFTELTGRIDAPEVKKGLDELKIPRDEPGAIDLCLATNMISVGLDVGRLGTMVVAGQPKETAEYIQATSRVGRSETKGMVFVMYGTQRPRDRSHYENFKHYHMSFYQHVGPSSLTAFSPQVRDRAMPGTLIGMCRSLTSSDNAYNDPRLKDIKIAKGAIVDRVKSIDEDEAVATEAQIDAIVQHWQDFTHERWEELNSDREKMGEKTPLMYVRGATVPEDWQERSFAVPTSMRNVEGECRVQVVSYYDVSDDDEEEE